MTEYMDNCEYFYTWKNFHHAVMKYIPKEFHSNLDLSSISFEGKLKTDGEEFIQTIIDKAGVDMRMYGTAKELAENIKIFKRFSGSHRYFEDESEPFHTTPIIYRNLKNQEFISKSDMFAVLQSMLIRVFKGTLPPLVSIICIYLLKDIEKRVGLGFVRFDKDVLDEIWNEFQNFAAFDLREESISLLEQVSMRLSHEDRFKKLKSYIHSDWSDAQSDRIETTLLLLENEMQSIEPEEATFEIACQFASANILTAILKSIMVERPEMFLSSTDQNPATVRLFDDGGQKFVMKDELLKALNIYKKCHCEFNIDTIPMEKVIREFDVKDIEFIHYPIQRTKHRAVPIQGIYPDDPCILAVDALFGHLRSHIFGHKFFQKFQTTDLTPIQQTFSNFETMFKPDYETPYFFKIMAVDAMEMGLKEQMAPADSIPAKNIRNVNPDGFTVQNLKNELVYLDLHLTFPEIQDHAEAVYAHLDKVKKEKFLRTCDMYDAVEMCQLICIFERLPNYKKFLHNQGGCGRVPGLKCDICDQRKKEEEQKDAQKLEGSENRGIESNSQTTLKAINSSENSDFKSTEVLKITLGAPDSQLAELNTKIASLEAQLAAQSEMSTKLESDLLKATQKNELLHLEHIKLQSENEVNKGVMCQLIDKLSINQESPRSIPIVTSSTSLIECIICHIDILNTQNTIKCPNCRIRFHKECALNYSKDHKECPSCKRTIQELAICLN